MPGGSLGVRLMAGRELGLTGTLLRVALGKAAVARNTDAATIADLSIMILLLHNAWENV